MFAVLSSYPLIAICRTRLFVLICFVLSSGFGGTAAAVSGKVDPTFGNDGLVAGPETTTVNAARAVKVLSDGKILIAGGCSNTLIAFCVSRLNSDGTIDLTFGNSSIGGLTIVEVPGGLIGYITALQVFSNGDILASGECYNGLPVRACLTRLHANGTIDESFGDAAFGHVVVATHVEFVSIDNGYSFVNDYRILLAGTCDVQHIRVACILAFTANGQIDPSFGGHGPGAMLGETFIGAPDEIVIGSAAAWLPDEKILIAGACYVSSGYGTCLSRRLSNGAPDPSFNHGMEFAPHSFMTSPYVRNIGLQSDGKIVLVGQSGGGHSFFLARFEANGDLDTTFNAAETPGYVLSRRALGTAKTVSIASDATIIAAGICGPELDFFCAASFLTNGTPDNAFGNAGVIVDKLGSDRVSGLTSVVQADGKVLFGMACSRGGYSKFCLLRLKGGPYYPLTCALNADANTTIESSTDALLILRYLLGYRGAALTDGVLGANPTRTGIALETYLTSLNLDADGDGQVNALTDGLLILRAMLGLSGNALTAGAVNTSHPSARNAQQILTWIESTHGVACLP